MYDIQQDKRRRKVAKLCKVQGLYRVQKSVFLGELDDRLLEGLVAESRKLIDEAEDSVYIFPMCRQDFRRVVTLGQAFDRQLVTDEIRTMFL